MKTRWGKVPKKLGIEDCRFYRRYKLYIKLYGSQEWLLEYLANRFWTGGKVLHVWKKCCCCCFTAEGCVQIWTVTGAFIIFTTWEKQFLKVWPAGEETPIIPHPTPPRKFLRNYSIWLHRAGKPYRILQVTDKICCVVVKLMVVVFFNAAILSHSFFLFLFYLTQWLYIQWLKQFWFVLSWILVWSAASWSTPTWFKPVIFPSSVLLLGLG